LFGRKRGVDLLDTPEMATFFARLDRLDDGQLLALRAAWGAIDEAEHQDAWTAVRAVGAEHGLSDEIDRVRAAALAWATDIINLSLWAPPKPRTHLKREAEEALVDAALAIALGSRLAVSLGSRLDVAAHDTLIGPWLAAIEGAG
jgi:hypothetical protein